MHYAACNLGPIEQFMVEDHARLDDLLRAATTGPAIDEEAFARFRHDLLRHIGMEEKVLLPYARSRRGGAPLPVAAALRADHGAIAKLLVRSPTAQSIDALRCILGRHNALEEGPDGLYAACDALAGDQAPAVVGRLRQQPSVPVAKYYDGPRARGRARAEDG
ncbi:MAG: hemerythrin domain-containing protein [Candidatus Limnocylindrales bacterium]